MASRSPSEESLQQPKTDSRSSRNLLRCARMSSMSLNRLRTRREIQKQNRRTRRTSLNQLRPLIRIKNLRHQSNILKKNQLKILKQLAQSDQLMGNKQQKILLEKEWRISKKIVKLSMRATQIRSHRLSLIKIWMEMQKMATIIRIKSII